MDHTTAAQASSVLQLTLDCKEPDDNFDSTRSSLLTRSAEIEEGKSHLDSIKSLIEENNEELKKLIREKKEIDDLVKERTEELNSVEMRIEAQSKEAESKERELSQAMDVLRECRECIEMGEKKLCYVMKRSVDCDIELKAKEERLRLMEEEVLMKQRYIEDRDIEYKEKEEELRLVEESIAKCSEVLDSKESLIKVVDSKMKDFTLLKESMEKWAWKIEEKEKQLEGWVGKLEDKERQFEILDEVELKEKCLDSLERSVKKWEEDFSSLRKSVQQSCQGSGITWNGRGLQHFMDEYLKRIDSIGSQLSAILEESSDPARLVLDAMQGFHPEKKELEFALRVRRRGCCLLLEELKRISPQISPQVREEAAKLAAGWKGKMTVAASADDVEVLGFLELVIAYNLSCMYDAKDLERLVSSISHGQQAAQLSQALGITSPTCIIISSPVKIEDLEYFTSNNTTTVSYPNFQPSEAVLTSPNSTVQDKPLATLPSPVDPAAKYVFGTQSLVSKVEPQKNRKREEPSTGSSTPKLPLTKMAKFGAGGSRPWLPPLLR